MKKYRVLREFPFQEVGKIVEVDDKSIVVGLNVNCLPRLISDGWIAEVPEEKELWEKLMDKPGSLLVKLPNQETIYSNTYWQEKAKIARQHFAEVARKAVERWNEGDYFEFNGKFSDYVISVIEKDGEK